MRSGQRMVEMLDGQKSVEGCGLSVLKVVGLDVGLLFYFFFSFFAWPLIGTGQFQ